MIDPDATAEWGDLLERLEEPPAPELAARVADTYDVSRARADEVVFAAIDDGPLVEDTEAGGAYGVVRLAESPNPSKTAESNPEESESEDKNPGCSYDSPAVEEDDLGDGRAVVEGTHYPKTITDRDYWVTWILDGVGRKRPVAPWKTGHAYPVEWNDDLPEDEKPQTNFGTAKRWSDFDLSHAGLSVPEDAQSDGLNLGIILPADRPDAEECITLIDWDDVRDPETGEIHPTAAEYINEYGGYVEVSTSGEGLHQFVLGRLRKRGKFIAPIDDEPFIGDDRPQVEIYDGGRHVAMTGRHVEGTGLDVITDGQPYIDELITEYAEAEKDAGHRVYDPETGEYDGEVDSGDGGDSGEVPEPKTGEYLGPEIDDLRETKPDDRSLAYHAVVEAFYRGGGNTDGFAHIQNWRLEGFAAALGERDGLNPEDVKDDLGGDYLDDTTVGCGCRHETPHRVDYAYERATSGRLEAPSWGTLVAYGVLPPELLDNDRGDEEYRTDPRDRVATVDARRAWDAAGRVTPSELEADLDLATTDDGEAWVAPNGDRIGDVVRAIAVATGRIDTADDDLDDYPAVYNAAREEYGAPLPRYYTTADAIAEFDAVLDVIGELTFWNLDEDALDTEITAEGDEVDGEAVAALDPAWRESESGESVLVFENGTVYDADTERVVDALRLVALDSGMIDEPGDALEGEAFTTAYQRARTEYGAPLPRWEPAEDGARAVTPQLPAAEELVGEFDFDGIDTDELEIAREEVEALLGDLTAEGGDPTVVTALPATGKTTGTIKTAGDRPLSYLSPRKELQKQALDKAERWDVHAEMCPVFCDEHPREEILGEAVTHVRQAGKTRLRDRWAILSEAFAAVGEDVPSDPEALFVDDADDEEVDLDRPTCETARGEHGVDWALAVHVARKLGYTPREIHQQAEGLFGAPLPCDAGEASCEYTDGWDTVADADNPADLLVGSYVHAHVESVRTHYDRGPDDEIERTSRGLVLDEFPGEAYTREFEEEAVDHATWLARSLVDRVEDRRDMRTAELGTDEWVTAWLEGNGDDVLIDTIGALGRIGALFEARENAGEILGEVEDSFLEDLGLLDALEAVVDDDPADAFGELVAAIGGVDPHQPGSGIARWADDEVRESLGEATLNGNLTPSVDAVDDDALPEEGDLRGLVDRAVEAVESGDSGAREAVEAAVVALRGGREGCRRLAAWADDGYAHPDAHHLLKADITPADEDATTRRMQMDNWAFDEAATDGTTVQYVETGEKSTVVADRNDHGAILHTPPARECGGGGEVPLVGLDATGRAELWSTALGEEVRTADIHTTERERAEFLESALSLRVIQADDRPRPYSGDPESKDTDGDVALLETIAEEYAGIEAPRARDAVVDAVGKPAAITTKDVREVLENDTRLDDVVAAWEHYGNVTGANDLGDHRLAAILGSQHYGDDAIERFCALAGEEVDTTRDGGRGAALDYGSELGNTYLQHMREDQVMQAALRFARGDSGATVVARTSALRGDLPVVGRGQVVETWNDTATEIARRYRRLGGEFTVADVADAVDVSKRQVRRVLGELQEAGYLRRVEAGNGRAGVWEPAADSPGAGEADLPQRGDAVETGSEPGRSAHSVYYTWYVQVVSVVEGGIAGDPAAEPSALGAPPSPTAVDGLEPPS